eukprot:TRINITY_DN2380_c0_g1_i1.p2 TRINITY_DN2380_c0_g1~~TRINITY_DN2380_c0_g1_i1.p2  ORF type:complete len:110 (+),score=7.00 TRINITY_DN2380_c0_g1_i1:109-438(+)
MCHQIIRDRRLLMSCKTGPMPAMSSGLQRPVFPRMKAKLEWILSVLKDRSLDLLGTCKPHHNRPMAGGMNMRDSLWPIQIKMRANLSSRTQGDKKCALSSTLHKAAGMG